MSIIDDIVDKLTKSNKYKHIKMIGDSAVYVHSGRVTADLLNAEALIKIDADNNIHVEDNMEILEHANFMGLDKRDPAIHQTIEMCFDDEGEFDGRSAKIKCTDTEFICECVDKFFECECKAIKYIASYATKNKLGKYGK